MKGLSVDELEFLFQFFEFFHNATVLEFTVRKHSCAGKSLSSDGCGFLGYLISDVIPIGVVEHISRLCQLSFSHTKGGAGDNGRSIEKGDCRVELAGHERTVVTASHKARHKRPDLEGSQHLSGGGEFSLDPDQGDRIIFSCVFSSDVVQTCRGDNCSLVS